MTKRPVVFCMPVCAAAFFLGVLHGVRIDFRLLLLVMAAVLTLLAVFLERPRIRMLLVIALAAASAFAYLAIYDLVLVRPVQLLSGKTATVSAVVSHDPTVYEDSQRAVLRISAGDGLPRSFKTQCYLPLTEQPLRAGDVIRLTLTFYQSSNAEGFDRAAYQAADGCFIASSYAKNADTKDGSPVYFEVAGSKRDHLLFLPERLSSRCRTAIGQLLPKREGSLLSALLFGDKSTLTEEDSIALRKAGLSHLVAVSGLHVGFLVGFCFLLFGKKWGTPLSVLLILFFIPMSGATPSVIRAGIMYCIAAGAFCLKRQAYSLNSLFIALAVLLITNPYAIASLGLQLSFLSTLGLILLSGKMQHKLLQVSETWPRPLHRVFSVLAGALSCTICATLFTTPVLLSSFGYVSVLSLVSNLLVVGITGFCFVSGFAACILFPFLPGLARIGMFAAPFLRYILFVANRIAALPFGLIHWGDAFGIAAVLLFFAAVLLWILAGPKVRWRIVLPACCGVICLCTVLGSAYAARHYTVTYLPCGTGQAVLISRAGSDLTVVDCSGSGHRDAAAKIREWMAWHEFSQIDTLILTAVDLGHARDLPQLLQNTPVGEIIIPTGCKQTKYNAGLLRLLDTTEVSVITAEGEMHVSDRLPLMVFPITDGKLGVQIDAHTLILHSPTQKQLTAFLEDNNKQGQILVLSQGHIADPDALRYAIAQTGAEGILLASGAPAISRFDGLPVVTPYETGEIQQVYPWKGESLCQQKLQPMEKRG